MKNTVSELVELIEAQEHDDLEPVMDSPLINIKFKSGFGYSSFAVAIPAGPVKKYSPEQIKALEAQMKAQGKL